MRAPTVHDSKCDHEAVITGLSAASAGFVQHYIAPLVYPGGMPRRMELIAGYSILTWNALIYTLVAVLLLRYD